MTWNQACKAMMGGCSVRRETWEAGYHIAVVPSSLDNAVRRCVGNTVSGFYTLDWDDMNARNWEYYDAEANS